MEAACALLLPGVERGMSINPLTVIKELDFERISGTAGERRARRILAGHLTRLKVAHREHSFRIRTSDKGQATLRIGGKTVPVQPFGLCGRLELNARIYPIRREIDPSLREKVEKYQYNSTRKKPDLHWRAAYEK